MNEPFFTFMGGGNRSSTIVKGSGLLEKGLVPRWLRCLCEKGYGTENTVSLATSM